MDDKLEKKILKEFEKSGLDLESFKTLYKTPKKKEGEIRKVGGKSVKYGLISDTHIGNKCYDPSIMDLAAKIFKREKVDFVLHAGDICDGLYTHRPGHVFELDQIGADEQTNKAVEELSKIEQKIYFITGNHTWNTFYKNAGHDIGKTIESRLDNAEYLGNADGIIEIDHGKKIQLLHPDGGTAYAISYRMQKIAESMEGGKKPEILHVGHFHKSEYLFYRNIHIFQAGTLERQTPFMKGKNISAHLGFWTIKLKVNKNGITEINPKFFPIY